ncbi:hypothetical protein NM688_g3807 [Phlebia brevispora]|uniref:Uncharacterized protein n=1 Tax=Phlebia brevispora TaxID=194682 RepID=A0ACC1T4Q4_9APHY|nr:hypothetical protein NM688_g3807 [Phlebia brevispora]
MSSDADRAERVAAAEVKHNKVLHNDPSEVQKRQEGMQGSFVSKTVELVKQLVKHCDCPPMTCPAPIAINHYGPS